MKSEFGVAINEDKLDASGGTVTGPLAVRLDDEWFPERGWSDFPVIVLGWWLRECAAIESGGNGRLHFMDGSFRLTVYPEPNGWAEVEFEDLHGDEAVVVGRGRALSSQVIREVRNAAGQVLASCRQRRWRSDDIEELALMIGEPPNNELQRTRPAPAMKPRR